MGIFDKASQGIGQLAGQFGGGNDKLLGAAAQLLSSQDIGGVQGLMRMFQQKGYGDTVSSWVSKGGEKKQISGDDVQNVLGRDRVHQVANQAGVSDQEASGGLASFLPQLIDKLTPDGQLPDNESSNSTLSSLASRFLGS